MTREEFNEKVLRFNQLIGLVNMKLREKKTLDEALKLNDVTIEEFEEMGISYDSKRNEVIKIRYVSYKDLKSTEQKKQPQNIEVFEQSDKSVLTSDRFKNEDLDHLKGIIENYSVLMEMAQAYKMNKNNFINEGTNKQIVIELPFEDDKLFRKTYRVNKIIAEQFESFCEEHKEYRVKDLISMAMKEYMEKYK